MQPDTNDPLWQSVEACLAPVLSPMGRDEECVQVHPPDELLDAWQKGWAPVPLQQDLQQHVASCRVCRRYLSMRALQRAMPEQGEFGEEGEEEVFVSDGAVDEHVSTSVAIDEPSEENDVPSMESAKPSLSRWWGLPTTLGALGLLIWFLVPPDAGVIAPGFRYPEGIKGPAWTKGVEKLYADFASRALLHLGVVDRPGGTVRRLHREQTCAPHQSLFFGFSLAKPGGYAYLFRVDPGEKSAPELLYPFQPAASEYLSGGTVHIVQHKGVTQRYPLRGESARVLFVLIQSPRPLDAGQRRQLLQQKSGWGGAFPALRRLRERRGVTYHRVLVRIKASIGVRKRP